MKKVVLLFTALLGFSVLIAGTVEKTYIFDKYKISRTGEYKTLSFDNATLMGRPGEPTLPYMAVSLMLPPGESAESIEIITENEVPVPGTFDIFPRQHSLPLSQSTGATFIRNDELYRSNTRYPSRPDGGGVSTQYMNGYAFALSAFTPVIYNPAMKSLSFYSKVTVRINTRPDAKAVKALSLMTTSPGAQKRVRLFAQNPEMISQYPSKPESPDSYQYLIITPTQFSTGFDSLINYYAENGILSQVVTTQDIYSNVAGPDNQSKIRNFIKQEVSNNNVEYVLLGGDVEHVPYRKFYCMAISGGVMQDSLIPADIYFSALDGEWNDSTLAGGNIKWWGEPGEDDLLPDVSVARCPFSNASELEHMMHKTLYYQKYPVPDEQTLPLFAGEYLYSPPPTWGGDYMELLIDDHNDNGYFTHGIPSETNEITKIYDSEFWTWTSTDLITEINRGHSFIHHLGHANETYMMKLYVDQITDQTFSQINGIAHNYTLVYTQGCYDGSFAYNDCIAEKSVTITNFLVAGIFNSSYGWFNQGTTDGPSQHLQREFVSAMYNDTISSRIKEIGSAHMMSKIKTAPYVGLPGEFEPGAQRWVHYDCNVLGDPALLVWTENNAPTGIDERTARTSTTVSPNPAREKTTVTVRGTAGTRISVSVVNNLGQTVLADQATLIPQSGTLSMDLNLTNLSTGIYFIRVSSESAGEVKKLTITR